MMSELIRTVKCVSTVPPYPKSCSSRPSVFWTAHISPPLFLQQQRARGEGGGEAPATVAGTSNTAAARVEVIDKRMGGRRSCLRTVQVQASVSTCGSSGASLLSTCPSTLCSYVSTLHPHSLPLPCPQVTDGWYCMQAVIDRPLAEKVLQGKIQVGGLDLLDPGELDPTDPGRHDLGRQDPVWINVTRLPTGHGIPGPP